MMLHLAPRDIYPLTPLNHFISKIRLRQTFVTIIRERSDLFTKYRDTKIANTKAS